MLLIIIFIKIILFINLTEIENNVFLVFSVSTIISLLLINRIFTSKKNKKFLLGTYYTIFSLVLFIDVLYYSHFQTLPSISMIGQLKLLPKVSSSVMRLIGLEEFLLIADLPLTYYYLKKRPFKTDRYLVKRICKSFRKVLFIFLIGTFLYSGVKGLNNSLRYQEIYSYHFHDLLKSIWEDQMVEALGFEISDEVLEDLMGRGMYKDDGNLSGLAKGRNLIVVQGEALQNFVINFNYNNQEITPNLNKLIADKASIYYDRYYQVTARGNTSDAEFVTNNSLYPATDVPTYSKYEDKTFYGLPWLLRDKGYTAWVFHGYEKDFWNRDQAYKGQGFQRFYSQEDFQFEETILMGIKDEDFFKQSVEILKKYKDENDKPFYAFMVSLSSHNPFNIPKKYHGLELLDRHKGTQLGDYLQAIHYFDYSFGVLVNELKFAGLYEDSIIAVYGDHFAIQKSDETDATMSELIGKPYGPEDVMNVPLIIHIPGEELGYTNSKIGSQLDFFPTILNILGYSNERGIIFGRDLNNYEEKNFVAPQSLMNEGSFINDEIVFCVPKNREFENSIAYDINSLQGKDIWEYKELYDYIQKEVEICDYLIKTNQIVYK